MCYCSAGFPATNAAGSRSSALLGVAREPVPRAIRESVKPELQAALNAVDASLAAEAAHFAGDFYTSDPPDTVTSVENALDRPQSTNHRAASEIHHQCSRR